jgi:hypothetical protein
MAVPLHPRLAASSVLANYKGSARGLARLQLRMLATAARTGVLNLWPAQLMSPPDPSSDPGSIESHLGHHLRQQVMVAIYTSPPRANRKPVLHVLDQRGRSIGYGKIGVNSLTRALVRGETSALTTLAERRLRCLRIPGVLYAGQWRGHQVLVQEAVHLARSASVPPGLLAAAMVEVNSDASRTVVDARNNLYVEALGARLAKIDTPRSRYLAAALTALRDEAQESDDLILGAWHGDWTPWNMAYDGKTMSVWDWERYHPGVPAGFDALHYASQTAIVRDRRTPAAAVQDLLAAAPGLVAPFGVNAADAERVALHYLLELGARYEGDGQEAAGATLGALETWLLPALASRLDLASAPVRR